MFEVIAGYVHNQWESVFWLGVEAVNKSNVRQHVVLSTFLHMSERVRSGWTVMQFDGCLLHTKKS